MKRTRIKSIISILPCSLLLMIWFIYCYGNANPNSEVGILVSSVISGYQENIKQFSQFFSSGKKNSDNFENLAIVEENDPELEKEELAQIQLMNAKKKVADLNNWTLPITGSYIITTYYSSYHQGIDYYSYNGYGSNILSVNNGTVYAVNTGCTSGNSSCNGGRGNYIIINHNNNNYYTLYMHLKDVYVNIGDIVSAGDVIASIGNTGYVIPSPSSYNPYAGAHLHFEVYIGVPDKGGYTINPLNLY